MSKTLLTTLLSTLILFFIGSISEIQAQDCELEFSLGNDTTINCNSSISLGAPEGYNYLWSTGDVTDSINVSQAGTYSVQVIENLGSITVNGDFSNGLTGFTSDYIPGTGGAFGLLSLEGQYAVSSNSSDVHDNFAFCFDHTQGDATGSMLIVNGAAIADQEIWTQTIAVTPNTDYIFSTWAMSVTPNNPGQLNFSINGSQIGLTFDIPATSCLWQEFFTTWNSGSATSATISIVNQNTQVAGNDFALDDIQFSPTCVFTDSIVVSLPPKPVLTLSGAQTICAGDSVTLTASSTIDGSTVNWQPGSLTGNEITVSPASSTQYTAIATSPADCNSIPKTVVITVDQGPNFTISGTDSICPAQTVTLTASSNTTGLSYNWSPGDLNGNSIEISPDETTVYTVTATPETGCPSSRSFTVNVRNPEVSITGTPLICQGQTISLSASSYFDPYEFTWQPGNVANDVIQVSPSETTTYSVTGLSDEGCESSATYTVEVVDPKITITGPSEICPGDTAMLNASADFPGFLYQWNPGSLSGANVELNPNSTTTYSITGVSSLGCSSDTTYTLTVLPIPVAEISGAGQICNGSEITLTASANIPGTLFIWNTEDSVSQITVDPSTTSDYSVVAIADNCPSQPAFATVTVYQVPIVYPPNDTLVCPAEPVTVFAGSNVVGGNYFWTPTEQTGDTITIDPVVAGFYTVSVESNGCTSVERFFNVGLLETCGCELVMPNIFTPNSDGKNDTFGPLEDDECEYTNFTLTVFNRWGKEVFSSSESGSRWDGMINDNQASEGVYFWTFSYGYTDRSLRTGNNSLSGEVSLSLGP